MIILKKYIYINREMFHEKKKKKRFAYSDLNLEPTTRETDTLPMS